MNDDYVLVLSKIKEIIGMEKFNNTNILIDRDNNLPDVITLKNVEILMTYIINLQVLSTNILRRSIITSIKDQQQLSIA